MEKLGYSYGEALNDRYESGFFAWFAGHGRHAASEDYDDIIDVLRRSELWVE